jgi:drug/metabolite transporter (DMT)-like permease
MDKQRHPVLRGAGYGLAAAVLFGLSVPMSKSLVAGVQPFILSGLYYLGAGLGLSCWRMVTHARLSRRGLPPGERPLTWKDAPLVAAAILIGGVAGGLLIMWGLRTTPASGASLLLNLELTFSALLAWVIFREHANMRVVLGMTAITLGAMALSIGDNAALKFAPGAWCIVLACSCWGLDNNLTRKLSAADPVQICALKGLVAGALNFCLGLLAGGILPALPIALAAMVVGFFAIGVSLVLFIFSMRFIGTARATAYFSVSPFIGAVTSVLLLHEPVGIGFVLATLLMGCGLWLHLTERGDHLSALSSL